jgi:hypothetical protein
MTFEAFTALIASQPDGVVLLEGRRSISPAQADLARRLGETLALSFPTLRFRSGNAPGSDEAFASGIAAVDPSRLQVFAPYSSHRTRFRYPEATYDSPASLDPLADESVAYKTIAASPKNHRLIEKRHEPGPLAAKAKYLLRDTMKVLGHGPDVPKPLAALFLIDPADPMAGGTGHTIRVCQLEAVPTLFQTHWQPWL